MCRKWRSALLNPQIGLPTYTTSGLTYPNTVNGRARFWRRSLVSTPPPIRREQIQAGTPGALETLDYMATIAREGSHDPRVRMLAVDLTSNCNQKDYFNEACAILRFVRDRIRYVRDFSTAELLQPPHFTLYTGAGDCDDKCILLASLLGSIGHNCRYVAIAQSPEAFSHVWLQAWIEGDWLDLEPTEPLPCGMRVPHAGIVDTITRNVD